MTRKVFIAGATGAVGKVVVRLAQERAIAFVPHVRPKPGRSDAPVGAAVVDLADAEGLGQAMRGCTTVMQLIGTIRARFGTGDTYETSDIGTTRQLLEGARRAGTVDHVVLLSALGAGRPVGAYLKAKAITEALVRDSGIPFTTFRPSAFEGGRHHVPAVFGAVTRALGMRRYEPIPIEVLAAALLRSAADRAPLGEVLEGEALWKLARP